MLPMACKVGSFTSASSPADLAVNVGFLPDYVKIIGAIAAAADIVGVEWFRDLGADKAVQYQALADNGATGNISPKYISSNGITLLDTTTDIPARWVASTVYAVGDMVVPTTLNGYFYRCTTAGTSHSAEPTWGTTVGGTTSEGGGTCVWTCVAMGDETYAKVRRTKVQGFTIAAELQKASSTYYYLALGPMPQP